MTIYYALYGLLLGFRAFFADRWGRTNAPYWIALLAMFVFSAFRWQVGCDWPGYQLHYAMSPSEVLHRLSGREPGYWLLIDILHRLNMPYYALNVVTSAIFFTGLNVLARRQLDPLGFLVLSFPILVLNMPMSGIRQGAAIGLLCIAFAAYSERKPIVYLAWVLSAAQLHSSSLAFAPLVTFIYGRFNLRNMAIATLLALPGLYLLLTGHTATVETARYIGKNIDSAGAPFRVTILALTSIVYFQYFSRAWAQRFPSDHLLASLGAALMLLDAVFLPVSSVISDRFSYSLMPIQIIILSRLPFLCRGDVRSISAFAPYLVFTLTFVVWTSISRHFNICYVPYESVLY